MHVICSRGFSGRETASPRWAKLFQMNFFPRLLSSRLSNQVGKIVFTVSEFALCLALMKLLVDTTSKQNLRGVTFKVKLDVGKILSHYLENSSKKARTLIG